MYYLKEVTLVFTLIAALNIATGIVLYRQELHDGITANTGTRRKAIMSCTVMALCFGGTSFVLLMIELVNLKKI